MKIAQIRSVIDLASWCRRDLSGHTRDEFMRRDVPAFLASEMDALRSLDIPVRFTQNRERRDHEIICCEAVIERWKGLQLANRPVLAALV